MTTTRGIRPTPSGWQAYISHRGRMISRRFPPETPMLVMRRWRTETQARAHLGAAQPTANRRLSDEVADYVAQRQTMPTLRYRRADLQLWLTVFGRDRDRRTITAGEIRAQLETWRNAGYAANTVNHRRTALMSLWTVLDGKSAPNPCKDVPRYRDESADAPRALSQPAVALLLATLPPSLTRARLALMAWTGWPPAQIARLAPEDIRWQDAVRLRPRRKGKGAAGVWLPLLPHAWAALEAFKTAGAWGAYSTSSARTSLRRAAATVRQTIMLPLAVWQELADVTPYQLRHSFGTLVAAITRDDRAVQTLLQHADLRTTHRYTTATADPRALAALGLVAAALGRHAHASDLPDATNRQNQAVNKP